MKIIGLHAELIANQFKSIVEGKGYKFFDGNKSFNMNIIGIRSDNPRAGKFDDALLVIQRSKSREWEVFSYRITTDPGDYYLRNPLNVEGTAILIPDQYRSTYMLGEHKGKAALVQQKGKVSVWRDSNKNATLDWGEGSENEGYYGINIHRSKSSGESSDVGKWSAGCQVFKNAGAFDEFIDLCKNSSKLYGNGFTYTLITQDDVDD